MRVCYFYKLIKTQKPLYLFYLIPPNLNPLRHQLWDAKTIVLKITLELMSLVVKEWNKLSTEICNLTSGKQFRKMLLSFIKPTWSSLFSIHHLVGAKLLVRLILGFSHFRENKFRHNFHDNLNALCSSSPKQLHTIFCTATTSLPLVQLL